jgi:hypothetical protein
MFITPLKCSIRFLVESNTRQPPPLVRHESAAMYGPMSGRLIAERPDGLAPVSLSLPLSETGRFNRSPSVDALQGLAPVRWQNHRAATATWWKATGISRLDEPQTIVGGQCS